ncbi:hypothetical protein BS78_10G026200 [Paspalum vaginatum]|nr:hypothetical protein BS78_10G026200 [Paspalum vaginatum]
MHRSGDFHHHVMAADAPPNNVCKAVALVLRLSTLALALASAIVMATASECTTYADGGGGTAITVVVTFKNYPPFVYLVAAAITATILEAAAVYLQIGKGGDHEAPPPAGPMLLSRALVAVADVAVQVLLYSATGAVFAAVAGYGDQISACAGGFCDQVHRSTIISLAASLSAGLAAVAKGVLIS